MSAIWIVRKHPKYPYGEGWLNSFTIYGAYSSRAEAVIVVNQKMQSKTRTHLYTIGKVITKKENKSHASITKAIG